MKEENDVDFHWGLVILRLAMIPITARASATTHLFENHDFCERDKEYVET
jgi:hypothetical protein